MAASSVGAQLYSVREFTKTIEELARTAGKIAEIGYTAVQLSGLGPMDPKEVGKVMSDSGLTVAATHVDWDRCLEHLDAVIEEHRLWGCRHVAIGGLPREYHDCDGLKRFLHELGPVAEKLAAAGMDFSYHNHSHELARCGPENKTWLAMLYEQADPKQLKAEIDTYWIQHGGGDPADWIRRCGGREPLVHLKDMAVTPDRQQRFAPVGAGNLNWPPILEACREGGVEWYLVEQDECYEADPFEAMAVSYRNLQAMGLS